MAVQIRNTGLLTIQRLVRAGKSTAGHLNYMDVLQNIYRRGLRTSTCGRLDEKEPRTTMSRTIALSRRRRPLSPLERISTLLPEDSLTPEVIQLRDRNQQHELREENITVRTDTENNPTEPDLLCGSDSEELADGASPTLPGESFLSNGELLIAEFRKKSRVEFQKMFKLQAGARLHSSWGYICHDDVVGHTAGRFFRTNMGVAIFIRRVSLEEYVLFMRRAPVITYPKDMASMLMMMDVTEGDTVLDSGSGSGAMSLFLSRAVGSKGRVLSVEVREDHHRRAVLNYERWRTSWRLRHGEDWPDNIQYCVADLRTASSLLSGHGFNSVALDLIHPQLVLETVTPHLHNGGVCAVYLANITQVIDLLEGIRCARLSLLCERIIEIPVRDWLVAPAIQKDGRFCSRKAPNLGEAQNEEEADDEAEESIFWTGIVEFVQDLIGSSAPGGNATFGSIPYIARPHPEQMSHTAFLVKLRKYCP
ncbi:tRNA (adenine(58)-N(1))-methyltransferase, mitochondrial isoform X1 [Synchiropus splendidus]|uniref:tRNA (adenine(58)-N(1))-methyltransferase, mitochondrial isoform X1 n=1 Tax=Synchiropus splendidus TaxID=270530 RepID=UPI00237DFA5F|nr:tRNA (adenine(58)-N(1))-methyltransferase, mitochondrial isoform X1 [Synchiropus splendidus]